MIIYYSWIKKVYGKAMLDNKKYAMCGWYLFGIIPLYVKKMEI